MTGKRQMLISLDICTNPTSN